MDKMMIIRILLCVLMVIVGSGLDISVSGNGRVTITPDTSMLSVAILTEAPYASLAVDSNAGNSSEILDSLQTFRDQDMIREGDIATVGFSINPVYLQVVNTSREGIEERSRRQDGYRVIHQLSVRIRNPNATGEVLDSISTISERSTATINVEGIRFYKDDITDDENQAISEAIKAARNTAQTIANEIGVSLGPVTEFSMESLLFPQPAETSFMTRASTTISVGTYTIERSVQLQYSAVYTFQTD